MKLPPAEALALGPLTILSYGALLSESSARLTFPSLRNFRLARVQVLPEGRLSSHDTSVCLSSGSACSNAVVATFLPRAAGSWYVGAWVRYPAACSRGPALHDEVEPWQGLRRTFAHPHTFLLSRKLIDPAKTLRIGCGPAPIPLPPQPPQRAPPPPAALETPAGDTHEQVSLGRAGAGERRDRRCRLRHRLRRRAASGVCGARAGVRLRTLALHAA